MMIVAMSMVLLPQLVRCDGCAQKKPHMDMMKGDLQWPQNEERACVICVEQQPFNRNLKCSYCAQDRMCVSHGTKCTKMADIQETCVEIFTDVKNAADAFKDAYFPTGHSKSPKLQEKFETCEKFLMTKTGDGKECLDYLERSYLLWALSEGDDEKEKYMKIIRLIEMSGQFEIQFASPDDNLSRLSELFSGDAQEVRMNAIKSLKEGPMKIIVPGTGASLEAAPLMATETPDFFFKSLKRQRTMDELTSLKSLIDRDFVETEKENVFLMKILAVLNMRVGSTASSHIFMEDAKRGLGDLEYSDAIVHNCQVRIYDVKGLPHRT